MMGAGPLLLPKAKREAVEAAAKRWAERHAGKLPDGFAEYALGAVARRPNKGRAESEQPQAESGQTQHNSLRFLVDNYAVPSKPEFKPLEESILKRNFHLEADPSAPKPLGGRRSVPKLKIRQMPEEPSRKRSRAGTGSDDEGADNAAARRNFEQNRLEQVLHETTDQLMRCKISKHGKHGFTFEGCGFPFDNPFAVRLERGGNVVPDSYFEVVTEPCDLTKIKDNVTNGNYKSFAEFERDIHLIISNSYKYHTNRGSALHKATALFEKEANKILARKRDKLGSA